MPNYDFHHLLEPLEFESFAVSLLNIRENVIFERFKEGTDGGIDSQYTVGNNDIVVQTKRVKTTYTALKSILKNELKKVEKINPKRYILVISMGLSPQQKNDILKLFNGVIKGSEDIITSDDINGYLELPQYFQLELNCSKLWLSSTNVLDYLLAKNLNSDIYNKSRLWYIKMKNELETFVPTSLFYESISMIEEKHTVILSGEAGIGKTVNSMGIANYYLEKRDFEELYFVQSVSELYKVLNVDKKQIYIFDDFWGKIQFSESRFYINDEEQLINIMEIFADDPTKRLIITTREYVLQQGFSSFLDVRDNYEEKKIILRLKEYTEQEKAAILFQHLHRSSLERSYIKYFYYLHDQIIDHNNYSPRLISDFLKKISFSNLTPEEYFLEFKNYLNNSKNIWEKIFLQLSQGAKLLSLILLTSEYGLFISELEYEFVEVARRLKMNIDRYDFDKYVKELENSLVNIESFYEYEGLFPIEAAYLDFLNPSVRDYLTIYLKKNKDIYFLPFIKGLNCIDQLLFFEDNKVLILLEKEKQVIYNQIVMKHDILSFSNMYLSETNTQPLLLEWRGMDSMKWTIISYLYEKTQYPPLFNLLSKCVDNIVLMLENDEKIFDEEIMVEIPSFLSRVRKSGILVSADKVIENYYKRCTFSNEIYFMDFFEEGYPKEYKKFKNLYFEEIKGEIEFLILSDIDFYTSDGMDYKIDMLKMNIPEILNKYNLNYTKDLEDEISMVLDEDKPINNNSSERKKINSVYEKLKAQKVEYSTYIDNAKEWLLEVNDNFLIENSDDSNFDVTLPLCVQEIIEKSNAYFYTMINNPNIRPKIVNFIERRNPLSNEDWQLYTEFADYLLSEVTEKEKVFNFLLMTSERLVLNAENHFQGNSIYLDKIDNIQEVIIQLLEVGIIVKGEKWFRFADDRLLLFFYLKNIFTKVNNMEIFYNDLLYNTKGIIMSLDFSFYNYPIENFFFSLLESADRINFNKYCLKPSLCNFLSKFSYYSDNLELVLKILKELNIVFKAAEKFEMGKIETSVIEELELIDICMNTDFVNMLVWDLGEELICENNFNSFFTLDKTEYICTVNEHLNDPLLEEVLNSLDVSSKIIYAYNAIEKIRAHFENDEYDISVKMGNNNLI